MNLRRVFHMRACLLAGALLLPYARLAAEPIRVKHPEASAHGFLVLTTLAGETLAMGDLIQSVRGDGIESKLVFHFKDGSLDSETTVFTQNPDFRLISNHHIQKGPSFPKPLDQTVDALTGMVTTRSVEKGKEKVETDHLDLPVDVMNGMVLSMVLNLSPHTPLTKVSIVAGAPKPRIVMLAISPDGEDSFDLGFLARKATRYLIKIEIGGVAGMVAPLMGKQPKDVRIWVSEGEQPIFLKEEGQTYMGGPVWRIKQFAASFPQDKGAAVKP